MEQDKVTSHYNSRAQPHSKKRAYSTTKLKSPSSAVDADQFMSVVFLHIVGHVTQVRQVNDNQYLDGTYVER